MGLYLMELPISGLKREDVSGLIEDVASSVGKGGGAVVEAQVGTATGRAYVIAEHEDRAALGRSVEGSRVPINEIAAVRLVGASLEDVKASRGAPNYLVEWDLPEGLEMDAYLLRKRTNSPNYAKVPEVRFLRTYVREDMMKCLCFYESPDEGAVRRAREAVSAPIDRVTPLADAADG
jgi:hypothetical protein